MRRLVAVVLGLTIGLSPTLLSAAEPLHVLKGRIIRALTVHPTDSNRILVGHKGKQAGSGKVFESRDGGRTWTTLNGGKAVSPAATDVQAVAYGPNGQILAGTWKQGLYVSRDDGAGFERVTDFPETDIRDLLVVPGNTQVIYAATGRRGLFASEDDGQSWQPLGPDKTFVWSLALSSANTAALYAASPSGSVIASMDGGTTWKTLFDEEGVYAVSAQAAGLDLAGETGLYRSADQGTWRKVSALGTVKLSSLLRVNPRALLAGSWDGGVYAITADDQVTAHLLPKVPVIHLRRAGAALLVGTWGQGLSIFPDYFASP